jgi:hypothetical protein
VDRPALPPHARCGLLSPWRQRPGAFRTDLSRPLYRGGELDGLRFDGESVIAERITEDADYEGVRVTFTAYLERARIPIQIDIGFGDAVTPAPVESNYPTLLESPSPRLLTYPKETVVAEKLEAMVKLGIANTRMKDFYDLDVLYQTFPFEGKILTSAIQNTFERRRTEFPAEGNLLAFTAEFYDDADKSRQWNAFAQKNRSYIEPIAFKVVVKRIAEFLVPVTVAVLEGVTLSKQWEPGGPWRLEQ